jgi:hypothetical protein
VIVLALLTHHARPEGAPEPSTHCVHWCYPPGVRLVGEVWLEAPWGYPCMVAVLEVERAASLSPLLAAWTDEFDVAVFPAAPREAPRQPFAGPARCGDVHTAWNGGGC